MNDFAVIKFNNATNDSWTELEIPLFISANELVQALNTAYVLGINTEDVSNCYMVSENPITFLRGNKSLKEFGIRNGSRIIYKRGKNERSV